MRNDAERPVTCFECAGKLVGNGSECRYVWIEMMWNWNWPFEVCPYCHQGGMDEGGKVIQDARECIRAYCRCRSYQWISSGSAIASERVGRVQCECRDKAWLVQGL